MNNPKITRRFQFTFDVNAEYQLPPIGPRNPELVRQIRQNFMDREDLFNQFMVNESLKSLCNFLGKMIAPGGILGYDTEKIIGIVVKNMPKEDILEWLDAKVNGWDYWIPPILDPYSSEVNRWRVENLDNNQQMDLAFKEHPLIQSNQKSGYLVAETDSEIIIGVVVIYYSNFPNGGIEMGFVEIDDAISFVKQSKKNPSLLRITIYSDTKLHNQQTKVAIKNYCLGKYPDLLISFRWEKRKTEFLANEVNSVSHFDNKLKRVVVD